MMLAGLPVPNDAVQELALLLRDVSREDLADRLDHALADDVKLLRAPSGRTCLLPISS